MRLIRRIFRRDRGTWARARERRPAWRADEANPPAYDVAFATLREYQSREIGLVSRELARRGLRSVLVGPAEPFDARIVRAAQEARLDLVSLDRYVAGDAIPRLLVVRSEVDDLVRGLVEHANGAGVATAAVAHPVINFTRHPRPYTASARVLCAGPFTAARMGRAGLVLTGFPGMDDLARVPRRPTLPPRILVNLSLPRGLGPRGVDIDAVRARWMGEVRGACAALGMPFVVSRHPSDRGDVRDWPLDPRSVYDVLPEVAAVVSPPSTVLMEAMSMGIPVVCHRDASLAPFEMDTFDEPHGAFRNTQDEPTLAGALREALARSDGPRDRFRAFLAEHLSAEPGRSMTVRVADELEALARGPRAV